MIIILDFERRDECLNYLIIQYSVFCFVFVTVTVTYTIISRKNYSIFNFQGQLDLVGTFYIGNIEHVFESSK